MRSKLKATLLLTLGAGAAAPAEVVERIPAVVDEHPILQSDVRLTEVVRGLRADQALEAVIDERLMFSEASRVPQATVGSDEEERALLRLLEEKPTLRARARETDLRRLVRRQLAILKYVEFRFRPQVRITEEDVERAYASEYGGKEGAPPLTAVAASLEQKLTQAALGERVDSWVRDLRAAADVRYNP